MGYITFEYSYVMVSKRERQQEMQAGGVKKERLRGVWGSKTEKRGRVYYERATIKTEAIV